MKRVSYGIGQGFDSGGLQLPDVESLRTEAYTLVARTFGGFHASIGHGGWIDPRGSLILEPSLVITSYVQPGDEVYIPRVADYLQRLFQQESVLIAVESINSVTFTEAIPVAA